MPPFPWQDACSISLRGNVMALTVKQAASRLGVSKSLIYQLCALGKLPHYRVGIGRGTIRVEEADLAAVKMMRIPELTIQPGLGLKHLSLSVAEAR